MNTSSVINIVTKGYSLLRKTEKIFRSKNKTSKNVTSKTSLSDHPDLEFKRKHHLYYIYFIGQFNNALGHSQMCVCNWCKSLVKKMREQGLSQNADRNASMELIVHKREQKNLYNELKTAKNNRDENIVGWCFV